MNSTASYLSPTPPPPDATLLEPREVAHELRMHVISVYRLLKQGRLRGYKKGSRWKVPREALAEYLVGRV